jgi:uncharacterized protein YkwD
MLAAAALAAALLAPATAAAADCPGQELEPSAANMAQVEAATLCLLNAERTPRGLPALRGNVQLRTAAVRHSADMVEQGYFSHDSLDGRSFTDRIDDAGYIPRSGRWVVGENIGWGSGSLGTPGLMVAGWMQSPGHRSNILDRDYREIGIGIAFEPPADPTQLLKATYTTDFGARPDRATSTRGKNAKKKKARKKRRKRRTRRGTSRRTRVVIVAELNGFGARR